MLRSAVIGGFLFGLAGSAAAMPPGLAGYYTVMGNDQGNGMVVEMRDCAGGRVCGRLVALGSLPAKDARNPSPKAQGRSLCGLDILSAAPDAGPTPQLRLLRGTLYDPRSGDETAIVLWIGDDGALQVSGHSGRPILSRSYVRPKEFWQPATSAQAACEGTRPVS